MPAYNAGKYIAEAVRSIAGQTYTNWELIIVNDGSTDDTSFVLKQLTDPRIGIYHQENGGQCTAANKAFSLSKGRFIKFMDADDVISPGYIAEQVKRIGDNDDVVASAAWGRFYNDDISSFKVNEDLIREDCKPIDWLVSSMDGKQAMMQCALWLIPRPLLEKSGLWDERLSLVNDFEFITRVLLQASEIRFAQNSVLYYRSGISNSLSALTSRRAIESAFTSIYEGTRYMLQHENSPRVRAAVADCLQNFVYAYYPHYPDIINKAQQCIDELGGSKAKYPAGGYTKMLNQLIGWKLTQKFKALFGR
ncbi:glycosyltransferase family 2 protein [Mucilaginibacter sp. UC70_90]